MSKANYIGIDVGTGSVRAGLLAQDGTILASSTQDTQTWRDPHNHRIFEQSTANIWFAICTTVRNAVAEAKVSPSTIKGIGFDATCSLAVTDMNGEPVTVTKGENLGQIGERNVILWADHRAEKEADLINNTGSKVLDYVGKVISLEMEVPKALWLKNNMPSAEFSRCQFFDLPDYLTYKATASTARSSCSLTCKCSYVPSSGWQADFFDKIGLGDFPKNNYKQFAGEGEVLNAGIPVGRGLTKKAAEELGLEEGTPVGSALIDAYSGWVGTIAAPYKEIREDGKVVDVIPSVSDSPHRVASVAGTSTCHLVQSPEGVFVDNVWGPYRDVVFPGWWMNEPGQSSTGQLLEFILMTHAAHGDLVKEAESRKTTIYAVLEEQLEKLRKEAGAETFTELTKDLHIYPDLHGNRAPLADPRMRGAIMGLQLDHSLSDLALKYHATLVAIALQTRHILDSLNASGHAITTIHMSGSQAKNSILMQLFADACSMDIVIPDDPSGAVVRGSAMLGRFAHETAARGGPSSAGKEQSEALWKIMVEMSPSAKLVKPAATEKEKRLLQAKYKIFRETIDIQRRWRNEMDNALST